MNGMWMKIKVWTKVTVFVITAILVILFVALNWAAKVEPELNLLFATYERPRLLVVLLLTALISVFGWWLFRTVFRTLRQLREAKEKSRTERLERDVADMKAKAAMLKTRPEASAEREEI